jgi:methylisocitrate lyase
MFVEALESAEEFARVGRTVELPLLANMTEFGKTPIVSAQEFAAWGYSLVIFPVSALRVAARAYGDLFEEIRRTGTQAGRIDRMQTRAELYDTIDYYAYEALDAHIARTVLPNRTARADGSSQEEGSDSLN